MNIITSTALHHLRDRGYYIEAPDAGANLERARNVLVAAGCQVFPPSRPPAPDTQWVPTKKGWRGRGREVVSSNPAYVWFRWIGDAGDPHKITTGSWRTWKTRAKARRAFLPPL